MRGTSQAVGQHQLSQNDLLLLRLARVVLTEDDRRAAAELSEGASWQTVAALARQGGIGGLVASHTGQFDLPLDVRRSMSAAPLMIERTNQRLVTFGLEICSAAEAAGLTLIPFKGTALNLGRPYDDLRLREQSDIDLLGRPEQFEQVRALLLGLGCRPSGPHEHSRRQRRELKFAYGGQRAPLLVELHWTPFFEPFRQRQLDEAALARAVPVTYKGRTIRLLDPVDTLLALALHLAVHRYREQLKWLVDVSELARQLVGSFDQAELWRRAAELRAVRAVAYVFELAHELLAAPLPPPVVSPRCMGPMRRLSPAEQLVRSAHQPSWLRCAAIDLLIRN